MIFGQWTKQRSVPLYIYIFYFLRRITATEIKVELDAVLVTIVEKYSHMDCRLLTWSSELSKSNGFAEDWVLSRIWKGATNPHHLSVLSFQKDINAKHVDAILDYRQEIGNRFFIALIVHQSIWFLPKFCHFLRWSGSIIIIIITLKFDLFL